jgi:TolA-binding protein
VTERLLERGATDLERSLLSAGEAEEPSAESARRAAAALGLGASVALAAQAARAGLASQTSAAVLRWAAVALVGAGGLLLVGQALRRHHTALPPPEVSVQLPEPPKAPAQAEVDSTPEPPSAPSAEAVAPKAGVRSSPTPHSPAPVALPSAASGSLGDEIALLDAARRALRSGDARLALSDLDRHQAEFPRGVLGQEATLLRIEALVRSGNRPAAEALARQFLARQPNSPHAKRIESLLGQAERR